MNNRKLGKSKRKRLRVAPIVPKISRNKDSKWPDNSDQICNLQLIKCECGHEILLIPDVTVMSEAIETHITEHTKKFKGSNAAVESERLRDILIAQALKLASETFTS